MIYYFFVLMSVFLAFIGQMLLKKAAISNANIASTLFSYYTWIGLFCYFIGALLWIIALSKMKLIYAYPFTFLTFALVMAGAFFIFGEKINVVNLLIGFALIVSGIIIINLGK